MRIANDSNLISLNQRESVMEECYSDAVRVNSTVVFGARNLSHRCKCMEMKREREVAEREMEEDGVWESTKKSLMFGE